MSTKELKYIYYLLIVKNQACKEWSDLIFYGIGKRILDKGYKYFWHYVPMYMNYRYPEVNMKKGAAVIETVLTTR